MGFSLGGSSSSKSQSQQTDPWGPAQPYLKDFLSNVGGQVSYGASPDQQAAFAALKNNAADGNPWTTNIAGATDDIFKAASDGSKQIAAGNTQLQGQLGDYASGKFLDPMSNPQMKAMLDQVGTEAQDRVDAKFAAAGRDMSGLNQSAVAKGVTSAQLPMLLDQYNKQQQNQMSAAKMLFDANGQAVTAQGNAAQLAGLGASMGDKALAARDYGANQILNLDQQIKQLPLQDLGLLASILYPAAGFGSQSTGTSSGKSSSAGFGFSLSDERAKENIEPVGKLASGETIYSYTYKGGDTPQIGLIAQEVEKKTPGAVHTDDKTGLKSVNYDAATRRAAEIIKERMAARKAG